MLSLYNACELACEQCFRHGVIAEGEYTHSALSFQRDCRIQKISCSFCIEYINEDVLKSVYLNILSVSQNDQKRDREVSCCSMCVTRE